MDDLARYWRENSASLAHALSDALWFHDADYRLGNRRSANGYRRLLWYLASNAEDYL